MRRAVRITRHAISPRLAIRIFLNIARLVPRRRPGSSPEQETARRAAWTPAFAGEQAYSLRSLVKRRAVVAEEAQHFVGGVGEVGAGAEDRLHARGAERGIILRRDDPAGDDLDVRAAHVLERLDHLRDQGAVARRERACADYVDVGL